MSDRIYKAAELKMEPGSRRVKFVASDESVDRMGDIIRANGWDLTDFKSNPVLLWSHQSDRPPIGTVPNIGISGKQLIAEAEFAARAVNPFADSIYEMVKAGIIRAVSVGFSPEERQIRTDKDGNFTGIEFLKQSLHELSVVSVPANQNALAIAKALHCSEDHIRQIFEPPVVPDPIRVRRNQLEVIKLRVYAH